MSQNGQCPFSWIQVSQPPGCLGSLMGAKPSQVWRPQLCMGAQCRLWDVGTSNCVLLKEGVASFSVAPPVRAVPLADRLKKIQPEDKAQASPEPPQLDAVPPAST